MQTALWWGTGLSLVSAVAVIIGVPWVVARLPKDYFNQPHRAAWRISADEPWYALVLGLVKNVVGALLVALGLVLLLTPGQGLLTLLVGFMLMNFPGKYRMERWLVSRRGVMKALDWLRARAGQPPFDPPTY